MLRVIINKNGEEFIRFDNLVGDTTNGETGITSYIDPIEIKNGDITVFIECTDATTFEVGFNLKRRGFGLNIMDFSQNYMLINTEVSVLSNKPITVVSQLPDIKVLDLTPII